MNDIIQNIMSRRSCRKFKEEQIKEEILSEIIEAGRFAPSGGNCQSCHLIMIQNQVILHEIDELVKDEFAKIEISDDMYTSIINSIKQSRNGNYHFFYNAPTLIIIANKIGYPNNIADSACLLQNMMLAASSLEIGSCWVNQLRWLDGNVQIHNKMLDLGLKEDEMITGGLALGYWDMQMNKPLERTGNVVTYIK